MLGQLKKDKSLQFKIREDSFKVNNKDIQSIQSEYIIKVLEWKVPNSKE